MKATNFAYLLGLIFFLVNTRCRSAKHSKLDGHTILPKTKVMIKDLLSSLQITEDVTTSAAIKKTFMKVSKAVAKMCPQFMAFSAVFSIVSIYLPQEESGEMKALKRGFRKLNGKIDDLSIAVNELKLVVENSSAKIILIDAIDTIQSLHDEMEIAKKRKSRLAWTYFEKLFENEFDHSTDKFYKTLYGSEESTDFRFDYLKIFKQNVKCAPKKISAFCITALQILNKGMAVEGSYLGVIRYPSRVRRLRIIWSRRQMKLRAICANMIGDCIMQWEEWASNIFDEATKGDDGSLPHHSFAIALEDLLKDAFPFRRFGIFTGDVIGKGDFKAYWLFGKETWSKEVITPRRYVVLMSSAHNNKCPDLSQALIYAKGYVVDSCKNAIINPFYYSATPVIVKRIYEILGRTATVIGGPTYLHGYLSARVQYSDRFTMYKTRQCVIEDYRFYNFC